ncbi:MAG: hypothetical protein HRU38_10785 [Saccharospirillaceae bacterium]|nr:hypothetical protein [Saccharospirillaceae bacterium]
MFNRCCECNFIVWPGTGSHISDGALHTSCHQNDISKIINGEPEKIKMYETELFEYHLRAGKQSGLDARKAFDQNDKYMSQYNSATMRGFQLFIMAIPQMSLWFTGSLLAIGIYTCIYLNP